MLKRSKTDDEYAGLDSTFAAACKAADAKKKRGKLPELIVRGSDPTATAKELAALIAKRDNFLFNGHVPVRIALEADCLPRALEVTTEMVRVLAHEICIPIKVSKIKGKVVQVPVPLSK